MKRKRQRCTCGSNYKLGDRIPMIALCLLCYGSGWRLPIK